MSTRGEHLVRADRRFSTGGLALLKPLAPAFRVVLDRIDAGLLSGGIDATLPDGSRRRLGFRTDGPVAIVRLNSWRAMLRLATSGSVGWYNAWLKGEWQSPDPVPLFDLFMRNGRSLGQVGRAKGLFKLANRAVQSVIHGVSFVKQGHGSPSFRPLRRFRDSGRRRVLHGFVPKGYFSLRLWRSSAKTSQTVNRA